MLILCKSFYFQSSFDFFHLGQLINAIYIVQPSDFCSLSRSVLVNASQQVVTSSPSHDGFEELGNELFNSDLPPSPSTIVDQIGYSSKKESNALLDFQKVDVSFEPIVYLTLTPFSHFTMEVERLQPPFSHRYPRLLQAWETSSSRSPHNFRPGQSWTNLSKSTFLRLTGGSSSSNLTSLRKLTRHGYQQLRLPHRSGTQNARHVT
jgi:hypothetical protein